VSVFKQIVTILLVPVYRRLRAVRTVLRCGRLYELRVVVSSTPPRKIRFRQCNSAGCAGDIAGITVHVDLFGTSIGRVNPEPCARASTWRASWHLRWDLEFSEAFPRGGMVGGEDNEVLRLDALRLGSGSVGDSENGSFDIIDILCMELEGVVAGTYVVTRADVTTRVGRVRRGSTLVTGNLDKNRASSGEIEVIPYIGGHVEVRLAVEPPIIEGELLERVLRLVCTRIVESEHGFVPDGSMSDNRRCECETEGDGRYDSRLHSVYSLFPSGSMFKKCRGG